ncbi:MAG: hypothetical protein ACI849_000005 [Patiriisocius sp.]
MEENNIYIPFELQGGLQIGYTSRGFLFGITGNLDSNWYNEGNRTNIENDRFYAKAYVGYRFDAPKLVEKTFNYINETLGL